MMSGKNCISEIKQMSEYNSKIWQLHYFSESFIQSSLSFLSLKIAPIFKLVLITIFCSKGNNGFNSADSIGTPVLFKKVAIPANYITKSNNLEYGGDIRIGDLMNNHEAAFVVYRAAHYITGGATQLCFIGAFTQEGEILWQKGEGGLQPNRPGPLAVYDIDNDGKTEVITLFARNPEDFDPQSMKNMSIQILDGSTGKLKKEASPFELTSSAGEGPNWVHQRILITNLRGNKTPQDFIIKLGKKIIAFDDQLNVLWTYWNDWDEYANCPAYVPAVGDMDNDGKDEINGGFYILNPEGKPLWEEKNSKNMDAVCIDYWDDMTKKRAFGSGYGQVFDENGAKILKLGEKNVPHGQELRVANFDNKFERNEMIIRYNGHNEDVMLINNKGDILQRYKLNNSPNNTGMEGVYWNGFNKPAVLYNGGMLWEADGSLSVKLPNLPLPKGNFRQGWYHCIPANITGDESEEVVIYNPWQKEIYIFGNQRVIDLNYEGYKNTPRQYNVRLLD